LVGPSDTISLKHFGRVLYGLEWLAHA
jgi:hypothetical protein